MASSSTASSAIMIVEIDTRKNPARTIFDSTNKSQIDEQAKQFWKTLTLATHIESSLYSKEINQLIKPNTLKPIMIDNSRKPPPVDLKTQAFIHNVQVLNQVDDIMKIQAKISKIDKIKQMHRKKKEKFNQVNNISRSVLMTSTVKPGDSKDSFQEKDELFERDDKRLDNLYEDEYEELDLNSANDREMVKNLD